mmetsp:Transcript_45002/g.146181  ORF Transcript_45002/g.146181 Transcript_45002/m.146181 type:complete len:420 (+) Transcript_45002:361-1620(+)
MSRTCPGRVPSAGGQDPSKGVTELGTRRLPVCLVDLCLSARSRLCVRVCGKSVGWEQEGTRTCPPLCRPAGAAHTPRLPEITRDCWCGLYPEQRSARARPPGTASARPVAHLSSALAPTPHRRQPVHAAHAHPRCRRRRRRRPRRPDVAGRSGAARGDERAQRHRRRRLCLQGWGWRRSAHRLACDDVGGARAVRGRHRPPPRLWRRRAGRDGCADGAGTGTGDGGTVRVAGALPEARVRNGAGDGDDAARRRPRATRHPPRSRRTLSRPSSARGRGGGPLGDRPADAAAAAAAGRDARRRTAARRRGELRRDDRVRRARRAGVDGAERGAGCALAHAHRRRGAARARRARRAALLHLLLRPRQGRRHPLPPVWPRLPPRVHRAVAPRQAHLPALQEPRGPAAVVRVISDSLRQSRAIS